jgi:hypothetical protein
LDAPKTETRARFKDFEEFYARFLVQTKYLIRRITALYDGKQ